MSQLVITKTIVTTEYRTKQPHVEVAKRMGYTRGFTPQVGDRVAYVITQGAKGLKEYEKAEDPLYVMEKGVPIDAKYYLETQLAKPLVTILSPILGFEKAEKLMKGDHTRKISVQTASFGLMRMLTKTARCLGCKKPLTNRNEKDNAVCANCAPNIGEWYSRTIDKVSDLEVRFGRLWTQCQRCQGSLYNEVLCTSNDCPILYMRSKVGKDLEAARQDLVRFDGNMAALEF